MTLENNDLRATYTGRTPDRRWIPKQGGGTAVGVLAAHSGAPLLPELTPLAWDESVSQWVVYTQPSDAAEYTITAAAAAASAGFFDLNVNGSILRSPFDIAAALLQTNLRLFLSAANMPGADGIVCVATTGTDLGDNDAVITITFPESFGAPALDLDGAGLTGDEHVLAQVDAGTALNGTNQIRAFVGDSGGRQTSATEEVQVLLAKAGTFHRDDINTAAIRAVLAGVPSEAELDAALADPSVRELGIDIQGLAGIH
jgi:hypothetical protein